MLIRLTTAAVLGFTVTAGLIFLMQYLVEISEAASESPRRPGTLSFHRTIDDTPVVPEEFPIERPPPPPVPPVTRPNTDKGETFTGIPSPQPPAPPRPTVDQAGIGYTDGGLMTIFMVEPQYPRIAADRGLEGRVLVRFDVTEAGTVSNAIVVESSNRIFDKAALDAAKRSRFKPKFVDGMPQPSYDVQKLFTFRMEQS